MSFSTDCDRKKPFSSLEKNLFLSIIEKYDTILSCKQTNATSVYKKKSTWEMIKEEFNTSSIVTQQASTKQLIKLWYNMKAKARESKTKENIRFLTGGGPAIVDMDPVDAKVMDIDKNILTNIEVDVDSDINGTVIFVGDENEKAWSKPSNEAVVEEKHYEPSTSATPRKIKYTGEKINQIDLLKCKILEEELEHKRKIHDEELKMAILEREYKEKILKIELQIKCGLLKAMENQTNK